MVSCSVSQLLAVIGVLIFEAGLLELKCRSLLPSHVPILDFLILILPGREGARPQDVGASGLSCLLRVHAAYGHTRLAEAVLCADFVEEFRLCVFTAFKVHLPSAMLGISSRVIRHALLDESDPRALSVVAASRVVDVGHAANSSSCRSGRSGHGPLQSVSSDIIDECSCIHRFTLGKNSFSSPDLRICTLHHFSSIPEIGHCFNRLLCLCLLTHADLSAAHNVRRATHELCLRGRIEVRNLGLNLTHGVVLFF